MTYLQVKPWPQKHSVCLGEAMVDHNKKFRQYFAYRGILIHHQVFKCVDNRNAVSKYLKTSKTRETPTFEKYLRSTDFGFGTKYSLKAAYFSNK